MTANGENHVLPLSAGGGGNGTRIWELTVYDQYRTPHEPFTDNSEVTVSPRSLNSELMCPICLDMLKNTMTTKECLHRFCQECITTALRSGNKECPTCRKKLVSKRSLRPDPNFDSLIAKIYPNREEYEQMQERALMSLNKHHSTEALQKSIEEGMKLQAELRKIYRVQPSSTSVAYENAEKKKKRKRDGSGGTTTTNQQHSDLESNVDAATSEVSASSTFRPKISEIELILRPHPDLDSTPNVSGVVKQTRYLKTTANATIDHLAKYLAIRIKLDCDEAARCQQQQNTPDNSFSCLIKSANNLASTPNNNGTGPNFTPANSQSSPVSSVVDSAHQSTVAAADQSSSTSETVVSSGAEPPVAEKRTRDLSFKIFVGQSGNSHVLSQIPGDQNVEQVRNRFWKIKKPLELHFSPTSASDWLQQPICSTNQNRADDYAKKSSAEATPTSTTTCTTSLMIINDENRPTTTTNDLN